MILGYERQKVIGLVLGVGLAAAAGTYIGRNGFTYREVIIAFVLLVGAFAVLGGRQGIITSAIGFIMTFALGYRTVEITTQLRIHAGEILIWGLFLLVLLQKGPRNKQVNSQLWLPSWLWFFMPFWLWGIIRGAFMSRPFDWMLAELKNFLLLIPLFVVFIYILREKQRWPRLFLAFYISGTIIAGMGLLEYLFPQVQSLFPGFIGNPIAGIAEEGFRRATFSFWGSPAATFVLVLTVPVALILWQTWRSSLPRFLIIMALILQVGAIYIGGYRSMWAMLTIQFVLFAILGPGIVWGALLLVPSITAYRFLPTTTQDRALSLILALEGKPIDSSATDRLSQLSQAWESLGNNLAGAGWAGAGWIHSDFLQVAVNLSLPAGLLFLAAYLITLFRLWQRWRRLSQDHEDRQAGVALLLAFIGIGGILLGQGVQVLAQLVLPVWFVWVLVEIWIRQEPTDVQKVQHVREPLVTTPKSRKQARLIRHT
ncbi:MAG: hypothetical protein V9G20_08005 [Candidatus Promineifilaceae bacterium]